MCHRIMADTTVDEITVPDIVQDPDEEEIVDKASEDGEIDVDGVQYATDVEINKEPFIVENIITVMMGDPLSLEADAYMNLCMGNIHSGMLIKNQTDSHVKYYRK